MKKQVFRKKLDYIVMAGLILLFGYFLCFEEVKELGDSFQYLNQFVTREPIYSLLLKGLTGIFGEGYTFPLCLIQNVLAIISIYWLYVIITDLFDLPILFEIGVVVLLVMPHIVTMFISKTRMIITNAVLTEGITFSLYYIWVGMLLIILMQKNGQKQMRGIMLSGLLSVVMALTRGQFLLCLMVWLLVSMYVFVIQKKYTKVALLILVFGFLFLGKTCFSKTYNYIESGIFTNTVAGKPMMLANALYVSDIEDGIAIEDMDLRQAYENMIMQIDKEQLSVKYAEGNIIERAQFHESGHEVINFDIIDPEIEAIIEKKDEVTVENYMLLMVKMDEYAGEIFYNILPNILPEYIRNYFVIASLGFVRSIAIDRSFLPLYALIMYMAAVIMMLFVARSDKNSNSVKFMLLSILLIVGTVFGTSIMIECISRYMIYNFPIFYIAGMTLITELWKNKKGIESNGV